MAGSFSRLSVRRRLQLATLLGFASILLCAILVLVTSRAAERSLVDFERDTENRRLAAELTADLAALRATSLELLSSWNGLAALRQAEPRVSGFRKRLVQVGGREEMARLLRTTELHAGIGAIEATLIQLNRRAKEKADAESAGDLIGASGAVTASLDELGVLNRHIETLSAELERLVAHLDDKSAESFAALRLGLHTALGLTLAATLGLLLIWWRVGRRLAAAILEPVDELREATAAIVESGDLRRRPRVEGDDVRSPDGSSRGDPSRALAGGRRPRPGHLVAERHWPRRRGGSRRLEPAGR